MTRYNVHIYREMKLCFLDIEADSPEQAAATCREFPDEAACGPAVDCDGETFAALVDVQGDSDDSQSVTIDFEAERLRKAAPGLLAACRMVVARWERGDLSEAVRACDAAIASATGCEGTLAQAPEAGFRPDPLDQTTRFDFAYEPEENPDRAYVLVDGLYDVSIIRTLEGLIVDVYPGNGLDPLSTLTAWDDDLADQGSDTTEDSPTGGCS
jgi:hypothetical protein